MAEPQEQIRRDLAALRLERDKAPAAAPRRPRLSLALAGGVLALLAVGIARLLTSGAPAVEVATATAVDADAGVEVLSGAGYVVSADRYISIGVRVPGRIDRYLAEEGDHVKAGDPLVQLDSRDYAAAVEHAEAALRYAEANANLKAKQLARAQALRADGVIAQDELDVRAAEAAVARAAVRQAEADLAQARVNLDYTTLYAPRSGVILAKLKEVGEIAVPGGFSGSGDLIRMANLDDLRGQVDVTESELSKVRLGQRARVVPDAYPDRRYSAHVVKLYPQIDRQKGTLRVEVQIEHPDDHLWPDMSARIAFLEQAAAGANGRLVLVPRRAVAGAGADAHVWTVVDGTVHRTAVSLGADFGDQVQVTAGLDGGESVVVGDTSALRDRQAVRTGAAR
jgi:RND family efflux transporter MFP subunit